MSVSPRAHPYTIHHASAPANPTWEWNQTLGRHLISVESALLCCFVNVLWLYAWLSLSLNVILWLVLLLFISRPIWTFSYLDNSVLFTCLSCHAYICGYLCMWTHNLIVCTYRFSSTMSKEMQTENIFILLSCWRNSFKHFAELFCFYFFCPSLNQKVTLLSLYCLFPQAFISGHFI